MSVLHGTPPVAELTEQAERTHRDENRQQPELFEELARPAELPVAVERAESPYQDAGRAERHGAEARVPVDVAAEPGHTIEDEHPEPHRGAEPAERDERDRREHVGRRQEKRPPPEA